MTTETTEIARTEYLLQLRPFCRALAQTLEKNNWNENLWSNVSGECLECGAHISGEDLKALAVHVGPAYTNPKISRLWFGYCARQRCNSFYYRLNFKTPEGFDWAALLARTEVGGFDERLIIPAKHSLLKWYPLSFGLKSNWRFWIVIAIIVLLFIAKQFYFGGSIPIVRTPENFKVDVDPAHQIH